MHRWLSIGGVLAGATIFFAVPLRGQNLIPNPDFDLNLNGWSFAAGTASWSSLDADGSASSGSVRLLNSRNDFSPVVLKGPCVVAPATVGAGAKYRIPSGQITDGTAKFFVDWYTTASGCGGELARRDALADTDPFAFDQWVSVGKYNLVAPLPVPPYQCAPFCCPCVPPPPAPPVKAQIEVDLVRGSSEGSGLQAYSDDFFLRQSTCAPNAEAACLNGGRFRVRADWETSGSSGHGAAVKISDDTSYFYFFNPANAELVVKVLNACTDPFNRYWVFGAGLTNLLVTLTVEDTQTQTVKTYVNPQGTAFQPIQDTDAFATCP